MTTNCVISGVGRSAVGRKLGRSGLSLTIEAVRRAFDDCGLDRDDIDGLSTWPGYLPEMNGMAPVGVPQLKEALRLKLDWFSGGIETPSQMGALANAVGAIEAGLARHVMVFRTITESTTQAALKGASKQEKKAAALPESFQWQIPFLAFSPTNWYAQFAAAHFERFGTTREQLAEIALNGRANALLNPEAVFRDPLTLEQYLGSRMISTPLCLLDCDMPADGATVLIVSHKDAARDLKRAPIAIEAIGCAMRGRDSMDQFEDLTRMESHFDSADMMWSKTDLKPADVDFGEIYDGFSFLTLAWLEALGFCPHGEAGRFLADGNIRRSGSLPINTDGGQLSGARLHGFGLLYEAVKQIRREAGDRQLAGRTDVAAVSIGGGAQAACCLLTR
jgi:acetyl-CoA acetyltransferase